MNRLIVQLAIASLLCVGLSQPAAAGGSRIAKAMGDLRWGMSETDVSRYLKRRMESLYRSQAKKATGLRRSRLEREAETRTAAIASSLTEFRGRPTKWDRGLVAHEFTHGNGESMLVAEGDKSTNYYFFINGSLWKWYKAFEPGALSTRTFKGFVNDMEKRFGTGYQKRGERAPGQGERDLVEWRDRNTRLQAVDESGTHRRFCLVFEDVTTIKDLAALRPNPDKRFARVSATHRRRPSARRQTLAASSNDSTEAAAKPETKAKGTRRSVFSRERNGPETEAEYQKRCDREIKRQKRAQRNKYDAKMEAKRAKALDALKGLEHDDPLSGL